MHDRLGESGSDYNKRQRIGNFHAIGGDSQQHQTTNKRKALDAVTERPGQTIAKFRHITATGAKADVFSLFFHDQRCAIRRQTQK